MAGTRTAEIASALDIMLKRIEHDEHRYRDCPLSALGVSCIGPRRPWDEEIDAAEAARFLVVKVHNLLQVVDSDFRHPLKYWEWRTFVYFKSVTAADSRDQRLAREQLTAFEIVCAELQSIVDRLPDDIRSRYGLVRSECWWKTLFHLAIHHPTVLLGVTRVRWVNLIDRPLDGAKGFGLFHTDKIFEYAVQLERHSPVEDIRPGTIWCSLDRDIFTSTKRAIEVLIDLVKRADVEEQPPDPKSFAKVLAEFEELAETAPPPEEPPASDMADVSDDGKWDWKGSDQHVSHPVTRSESDAYAEERDRCCEPLVIRLGSPYSTPPVWEWCEPLSPEADRFLPSARWHDFAEFVTYRNMPPRFEGLCGRAGALLPDGRGIVPLRSRGQEPSIDGPRCSDFAVPASDPIVRWIRFVFETLRELCPEEVVATFLEPAGGAAIWPWAPYGYLQLKGGFFRASAMAILLKYPQSKSKEIVTPDALGSPSAPTQESPDQAFRERAILGGLKDNVQKAYRQYLEIVIRLREEENNPKLKVTFARAFKVIKKRMPGEITVGRNAWSKYVGVACKQLGKPRNLPRSKRRAMPDTPYAVPRSHFQDDGSD